MILCTMTKSKYGFTLVELSIVLIIIGLIVSGVIAGKALIDAAKIRAQAKQIETFKTAYYTFQLKYDELPGDMPNASSYWSGATDGDGDGIVTGRALIAYYLSDEQVIFFEHLSRAGLVKGEFDNVFTIDSGFPSLKTDSSKGMVAGSQCCTGAFFASQRQLSQPFSEKIYTAVLYFNVVDPDAGAAFDDNIGTMTVLQSKIIDQKIDDGVANSGKFIAHRTSGSTEGDCLDGVDGDYLISSPDNLACNPWYIIEK